MLSSSAGAADAFARAAIDFFDAAFADITLDLVIRDLEVLGCASGIEELANTQHVVMGPVLSPCAIAAALQAVVHELPIVSPGAAASELSNKTVYPYFFRTALSTQVAGEDTAAALLQLGLRCLLVIHDEANAVVTDTARSVMEHAGASGMQVTMLSYRGDDAESIRAVARAAVEAGTPHIFLSTYACPRAGWLGGVVESELLTQTYREVAGGGGSSRSRERGTHRHRHTHTDTDTQTDTDTDTDTHTHTHTHSLSLSCMRTALCAAWWHDYRPIPGSPRSQPVTGLYATERKKDIARASCRLHSR